jgi:hypothetical protein
MVLRPWTTAQKPTIDEPRFLRVRVLGARRAGDLSSGAPANDQTRAPRCTGADLVRLLTSLTPDPDFADDIEAAVREMRSEPVTSPWDR